jgi:uncharacterized protein
MTVSVDTVIKKYYPTNSKAYYILKKHSEIVAHKAVSIAKRVKYLNPDITFIRKAALLHDIGIYFVYAPKIGCYGKEPYVKHGVLGRELLEKEGLEGYALVSERHIGVGITKKEIREKKLSLPERDMLPITTEEEIVALADKFFSKSVKNLKGEKSVLQIKKELRFHGEDKVVVFERWLEKYNIL